MINSLILISFHCYRQPTNIYLNIIISNEFYLMQKKKKKNVYCMPSIIIIIIIIVIILERKLYISLYFICMSVVKCSTIILFFFLSFSLCRLLLTSSLRPRFPSVPVSSSRVDAGRGSSTVLPAGLSGERQCFCHQLQSVSVAY